MFRLCNNPDSDANFPAHSLTGQNYFGDMMGNYTVSDSIIVMADQRNISF